MISRDEVIKTYLINSPKVVAEMLYDTIEKYESRTCENCKLYIAIKCPVQERDADDSFGCNKFEPKDK